MTNENHKGFKTLLEQCGFTTSESNNSCEEFFSIKVHDREGKMICEPMLFRNRTIQSDMQSFPNPLAFVQSIKPTP